MLEVLEPSFRTAIVLGRFGPTFPNLCGELAGDTSQRRRLTIPANGERTFLLIFSDVEGWAIIVHF